VPKSRTSRLPRLRAAGVAALVAVSLASAGATAPAAAPASGVDPGTVELTLGPGQSATVAKRVTTPTTAPDPDIVLLGDTTGSMDPVVANVRNNLDTIMDRVRAAQPSARFAVLGYKDQVDGDKALTVYTNLTGDANQVRAGVNTMSFDVFGGGAPWTDYLNALFRTGTDAVAFRPTGSRIVAWFGDAASRDPSLGHTLADTTNALRASGIRVIAVPVTGTSGDGLDRLGQATAITSATGGAVLPNASADQVADALLAGIQSLQVPVTPRITSCDAALSAGFDPPSRTVRSGSDATFTETLRVSPTATPGTYHCAVDFLVNGISQGFVENTTVHVPGLSIGDVTLAEGDSGSTLATFPVTLDRPATGEVRVHWATADGTATAPADYTASAGDLVFPPGTTTQTASVPIVGDLAVEPDETFTVTLSTPSGAAIADGSAVGTIRGDDQTGQRPKLSIGDVSVTEGNTGTTAATFTVSLDRPSAATVTVRAATADGTATAPGDYTARAATITFAPGQTSQPFTVAVAGDTAVEPDETFTVTLSNPSGADLLDAQGAGTIVNDDQPPHLSIGDASVTEGNAGTTPATFTLTLDHASSTPVTVHWATANGTATAPADYTASGGDVTFAAGQTSATVSVPVIGELANEPDETFTVNLTNPVGAEIVDGQGVGTIVNDDPVGPAQLSVNDVTVTEGNSGTTPATFTIRLNQPSPAEVRVHWTTQDGTATAPSDYTAGGSDVVFAPGETTKQITVLIIGDTAAEPDETFAVTLSGAQGADIADAQGVDTILNDDATIRVSIGDSSVTEGNSGTTPATFTLTLDHAPTAPVTVHWATADGTATAPSDYTASSGNVSFNAGQTSATVSVPVVGDLINEPDETFTVNLSGADILDGQGVGTIVNDDPVGTPRIGIDDVRLNEGNAGTTDAVFTVSLNQSAPGEVRVHWATQDGTATAPGDYTAGSGDVVVAPGETSKQVRVPIVGDTVVEPDETFAVVLSNASGADLADDHGVGTILNDDTEIVRPKLSIGDASAAEGNAGVTPLTFTISLDRAATGPVSVHWQTADGTATAPSDYTAAGGDVTFAAGQVSQQVSVNIIGDTTVESDETFAVTLNNASGADLADGQGVGTILNDDNGNPNPRLSIGDASVAEGNAGTTPLTFTVSLSQAPASGSVSVHWQTADGTATAPGDYTASGGDLDFGPGQTSRQVSVPVVGDTAVEPDETFAVNLTNAAGADIADGQGVGTIVNDDGVVGTPALSIGDVTVTEGDTGTTAATFTVSLDHAATGPVTVHVATVDGTATAPGDYRTVAGDLRFAPGVTSLPVTVEVVGDLVSEPTETFTVRLSSASGAEIAHGQGVGTIVDNDGAGTFTCTATALNLAGTPANPANSPCRSDATATARLTIGLGLLSVTGSALSASTEVAATSAISSAQLASTRISALGLVSIEVGAITSTATVSCVNGVPVFAGGSAIAALKINGVAIPLGPGTLRIPLLIGTLELNTTTVTANSVTQRAFALTSLLGGVVIGEARVGTQGNPCR
jgi:large repetitive protein